MSFVDVIKKLSYNWVDSCSSWPLPHLGAVGGLRMCKNLGLSWIFKWQSNGWIATWIDRYQR